ncbi:hypothetical protein EVAR_16628_1 [Eumeta japonica]|uniref:Uncharacterized protein n=1 Tax=Eumeta variegata TaxID=151549 RepID=A0A4C1V1B0_EUMVA|nr:hypothetical protein EVAR_16628_1 [Eumeta japonica]
MCNTGSRHKCATPARTMRAAGHAASSNVKSHYDSIAYTTSDPSRERRGRMHALAAMGEFFSGFQPHTTHTYGREGVRDRHYLPPPRRKREKKRIRSFLDNIFRLATSSFSLSIDQYILNNVFGYTFYFNQC